MNFFDRIMEIVCPCCTKKKTNVFLEEIVVEEPCDELREVIIVS
jgi:hypothetical protein